MDDKRDQSLRLYNVLENVGASEELRRLHRETAITAEILDTVGGSVKFDFEYNTYRCGSSNEGSVTPDLTSDCDIIHCLGYIPVVSDVQSPSPIESCLIVRDQWTYPGYVKLQRVLIGCPLMAGHNLPPIDGSKFDWTSRLCLKPFPGENMHGPADKRIDKKGMHIVDHVSALKCKSIPSYALGWFLRKRPYARPAQCQLQEMSRLGCMFVGAGHVYSGEKDIEWRLSFTQQERQLMSELTPVQHKVFVLLKLIKKNILGQVFKIETLTSYHLKTCILFAVQMTPAQAWKEENLINCLLQCVKLLIKWLEQGSCPNFFIKDQNLFMRKGFNPPLRGSLLNVMGYIIEMDANILYQIQSDNIGVLLRLGDIRPYHKTTAMKKNEYVYKLKGFVLNSIYMNYRRIIHYLSRGNDPHSLERLLDDLQKTETINSHSVEVTQSSLAYLYPYLHLHIAKAKVSLAYMYPNELDHQRLMKAADYHFSKSSGSDLVNERLARATVLYKSEQYDECFFLLQQIENDFVLQVRVTCPCRAKYSITYTYNHNKYEHEKRIADMSMRAIVQSSTVFCVIFLPSEKEIVPCPLQYEMQRSEGTLRSSRGEFHVWFDWAVVNPRIYMHFLQYLVTCKLDNESHRQVAVNNLREVIARDNEHMMSGSESNLRHKETAYNLLGWIHIQEGRFAEAFLCFAESWKIRPYHNAAKFHMFNFVAKLSGKDNVF